MTNTHPVPTSCGASVGERGTGMSDSGARGAVALEEQAPTLDHFLAQGLAGTTGFRGSSRGNPSSAAFARFGGFRAAPVRCDMTSSTRASKVSNSASQWKAPQMADSTFERLGPAWAIREFPGASIGSSSAMAGSAGDTGASPSLEKLLPRVSPVYVAQHDLQVAAEYARLSRRMRENEGAARRAGLESPHADDADRNGRFVVEVSSVEYAGVALLVSTPMVK